MIRILVIVSISLAAVRSAAARGQGLTVEASPRAVTLGAETGADVRVLLAGAPAPRARWASTIGRVEAGRFDPGDHHTPAYVIVAAAVQAPDDRREHRGAIVLELVGRGELATHTSPGALVTVEIQDRRFGPMRADGRGNVAVPVEVPPGAARAKVLAVDRRGLETARERALPPAEWPRGLVIAPQRLSPGERGIVTVFAIDGRGEWRRSNSRPVVASSSRSLRVGEVRPVGAGRWDAEVSVASDAAGGPIDLAASIDGEALPAATVDVAGPLAAAGTGTPAAVTAAHEPRGDRILVGLHAGLASATDDPSKLAAVDVAIPLRLVGPLRLHIVAAIGMAFGEGADQQDRPADLTQLFGAVGVHLRAPFARWFFGEAGVGAGLGWMSVDLYRKNGGFLRNDSDTAALGYAALGLGVRLGPGEIALEARWVEVQFDPFQKIVEGTSLGFTSTLGYRLVF